MKYFAGLDVSLEETAICIVDETGRIVRELRAASEPQALSETLASAQLPLERIGLDRPGRLRLASVSAAVILLYVLAVYLILFITWTPIDIPTIAGVQGRYFVVILPALAVLCSALVNRTSPRAVPVAAALTGAVVAGFATIEAIVRPAVAAG
jgi:hypothetical protein